ncbi:hypothetical protein KSP35_14170 [Aquihabitans sp. G128]|uniref:hypothetical protein n=1 Tax=Aquihabitans sp. G128 TaxID=2849779 RepID=UPI001C239DC4|nr:hypothetical protein [Aquihabitans sp. G128]QXC59530.1 hypothetical protein KSP35_14170 [Aquihabitans sp. G128]
MRRNWNQIGGELIVVLTLAMWSGQLWWPLLCAVVLLPGLRSLWRHPRTAA